MLILKAVIPSCKFLLPEGILTFTPSSLKQFKNFQNFTGSHCIFLKTYKLTEECNTVFFLKLDQFHGEANYDKGKIHRVNICRSISYKFPTPFQTFLLLIRGRVLLNSRNDSVLPLVNQKSYLNQSLAYLT